MTIAPVSGPVSGVTAVIQARMASTRLPGKVLLDLGGRSVLSWVIRAARSSSACDRIVVATTKEPEDDAVVEAAHSCGVDAHRGPISDVITRFRGAMARDDATAVVRLTADCPLLDPALVAAVVACYRATGVDYVSTVAPRSLPRGLDVELVSTRALARLDELAGGVDRVHVTSAIASHADLFTALGISVTPAADHLRVTLDTHDDYRLLSTLVDRLGDEPPSWQRVVRELEADAGLVAINAAVRQKAVCEG